MKSLGQIAWERFVTTVGAGSMTNWENLPPIGHAAYEAAAQAVRAAVLEEAAQACDKMIKPRLSGEERNMAEICAQEIRNLK